MNTKMLKIKITYLKSKESKLIHSVKVSVQINNLPFI